MLNSRDSASLDRYITGNYGEDQFDHQEFPDTAHAAGLVNNGVYVYDPADDGPECEIITRHLAKYIFYAPGAEAKAVEFSIMLNAASLILNRRPFDRLTAPQEARTRNEVARKYAVLGF